MRHKVTIHYTVQCVWKDTIFMTFKWLFFSFLQADTDELYQRWITSLQQGISTALHETIHKESARSSPADSASKLQWEDSDNDEAADGSSNSHSGPNDFLASNRGVFLNSRFTAWLSKGCVNNSFSSDYFGRMHR